MTRPAPANPRSDPAEPEANAAGPPGGAPTHLVVGRILAPWGHRGEVRVEILTDFPDRFEELGVILAGDSLQPYRLESTRLHQGNAILKLEGIDDPHRAGELRGALLYVPMEQAVPLGEDQYYHHQILGLEVWTTTGGFLGQVTDILETGSNDVYVARRERREVLIPALADVVREVDLERHRLVVALPPGLVEEEEA